MAKRARVEINVQEAVVMLPTTKHCIHQLTNNSLPGLDSIQCLEPKDMAETDPTSVTTHRNKDTVEVLLPRGGKIMQRMILTPVSGVDMQSFESLIQGRLHIEPVPPALRDFQSSPEGSEEEQGQTQNQPDTEPAVVEIPEPVSTSSGEHSEENIVPDLTSHDASAEESKTSVEVKAALSILTTKIHPKEQSVSLGRAAVLVELSEAGIQDPEAALVALEKTGFCKIEGEGNNSLVTIFRTRELALATERQQPKEKQAEQPEPTERPEKVEKPKPPTIQPPEPEEQGVEMNAETKKALEILLKKLPPKEDSVILTKGATINTLSEEGVKDPEAALTALEKDGRCILEKKGRGFRVTVLRPEGETEAPSPVPGSQAPNKYGIDLQAALEKFGEACNKFPPGTLVGMNDDNKLELKVPLSTWAPEDAKVDLCDDDGGPVLKITTVEEVDLSDLTDQRELSLEGDHLVVVLATAGSEI